MQKLYTNPTCKPYTTAFEDETHEIDKESKSRRDKKSKSQREEETKRGRVKDKGVRGDAESEGSRRQTSALTDRNMI